MEELAKAAAGVPPARVGCQPTLSPFPATMYVPTVPPTAGFFPQADVQATVEATQGDVKKKPRGDPDRHKKNREKKRRMLQDYEELAAQNKGLRAEVHRLKAEKGAVRGRTTEGGLGGDGDFSKQCSQSHAGIWESIIVVRSERNIQDQLQEIRVGLETSYCDRRHHLAVRKEFAEEMMEGRDVGRYLSFL